MTNQEVHYFGQQVNKINTQNNPYFYTYFPHKLENYWIKFSPSPNLITTSSRCKTYLIQTRHKHTSSIHKVICENIPALNAISPTAGAWLSLCLLPHHSWKLPPYCIPLSSMTDWIQHSPETPVLFLFLSPLGTFMTFIAFPIQSIFYKERTCIFASTAWKKLLQVWCEHAIREDSLLAIFWEADIHIHNIVYYQKAVLFGLVRMDFNS